MKRVRLKTQRLRLALIAAGTSGAILAAVFVGMVWLFRVKELQSAYDLLHPAALAAAEEIRQHPNSPELEEIVGPNPDISVGAFTPGRKLIKRAGLIKLRPLGDRGKATFGKADAIYISQPGPSGSLIMVALPWRTREAAVEQLAIFLALLYVPLVASAGLTTWLASRSTFQPLADLATQAESLSATDLSHRLAIHGTDEYQLVAARLNRFLDLLQASVQRQERFVADAAHELRTPLTVLRGQIETTLSRSREAAEYQDTLHVALAEAVRLSRLVESLLLSASATSITPNELDLEQALDQAQARWIDRYVKAGVELVVTAEPSFAALLPEEWDSVVDNLLSNALKHSSTGKRVAIQVTATGAEVQLAVEDEGPGVPPELRESLFERFTRAEGSRNRDLGGFGIGLAVVKRIVEARGGTVELASSVQGAKFIVLLPNVGPPSLPLTTPVPAKSAG